MAQVGSLSVSVGLDTSKFERGMKRLQSQTKRIGQTMTSAGRKMSIGLSLPIAGLGTLAVKSASDFESSFANIRKTVTATESEFATIEKQIRALAKETPTSVNELNRLAGVAGQLGVEARNITKFTRTIAMLGDTTDVSGEQAALSLSRFMNVMGTSQMDVDRLGSTIVGLGNNFAAMESEIIETGTSLAAFGSQVGLSESEVLAFATTIAASGGKTQAASTAFQKTANLMKDAVITGNENLRTFADTANMTAREFQQLFEKDSARAIQAFLKGLKRIGDAGGSTASVLDELGLADQRLIREFGKVIGNLDQLEEALGEADSAWENNTALTDEAQKRYKTFSSKLKILRNAANDLAIQFGNVLIPAIEKLIEKVKGAISWMSDLSADQKQMIVIAASLTAALGPLSMGLGVLVKSIGAVTGAVRVLTTAIAANPLGLLLTGVAVLVSAVGLPLLFKHMDEIQKGLAPLKSAVNEVFKAFKELFGAVKKIAKEFADLVGIPIDVFFEDLALFLRLSTGPLRIILNRVSSVIGAFKDFLTLDLKGFIEKMWDFSDVTSVVKKDVEAIRDGLGAMAASVGEVTDIFGGFVSKLKDYREQQSNAEDETNDTKDSISRQADAVEKLTGKYGTLKDALKAFIKEEQKTKQQDQGPMANLGGPVEANIPEGPSLMEQNIDRLKGKMMDLASTVRNNTQQAFTSFFNTLRDTKNLNKAFESFGDVIVQVLQRLITKLIATAVAALAVSAALSVITGGGAAAAGGGSVFGSVFKNMLGFGGGGAGGGLLSGITGMAEGGIVPPGFPNDSFPARLSSNEAVIPLDKMRNMGGTNVQVEVTGVARGEDIVYVADRVRKRVNRFS